MWRICAVIRAQRNKFFGSLCGFSIKFVLIRGELKKYRYIAPNI